jgi:hypothetical protein
MAKNHGNPKSIALLTPADRFTILMEQVRERLNLPPAKRGRGGA